MIAIPGHEDDVRRVEQLVALEPIIEPHSGVGQVARDADERERGDLEDGATDAERALDDERRQRVRQDPPGQDADRRLAERARRGDEVGSRGRTARTTRTTRA